MTHIPFKLLYNSQVICSIRLNPKSPESISAIMGVEDERKTRFGEQLGQMKRQNRNDSKESRKSAAAEQGSKKISFVQKKTKMILIDREQPQSRRKPQLDHQPGITIGHAIRPIDKPVAEQSPGPSTYSPAFDRKKGPAITFPQAAHSFQNQKTLNMIGPGSYEERSSIIKANIPQYTMAYKESSIFKLKNDIPGPADYDTVPHSLQKAKSLSSFGGAKRFVEKKQNIPGPAEYNKKILDGRTSSTKGTISIYEKQSNIGQKSTPGPANYEKISPFELNRQRGKGISMGKKTSQNSSALPNITEKAFNKYEFKEYIGKSKEKAYSIGKAERDMPNANRNNPSPVDYDGASFSIYRPTYGIFPRSKEYESCKPSITPGPGQYQTSLPQKSVIYSIPRSKSTLAVSHSSRNNFPGVGAYHKESSNTSLLTKKGFLFPKSNRPDIAEVMSSVGVGSYNIDDRSASQSGYTIPTSGINIKENKAAAKY